MDNKTTHFQQLYAQYEQDVFRFSFWLSGTSEEAQDITSETFIRLWTARVDIKAETVKGYLLIIARNIYLQNKRKRQEHVELNPGLVDPAPNADKITAAQAELEQVIRLLQQLPEADRSALIMRAYEGLSYQEISGLLGLSVTALKVKVYRARLKLAASHQENFHDNN